MKKKYNFRIGYCDRNMANRGGIVFDDAAKIKLILFDTVLPRIGASTIYCNFEKDGSKYKADKKSGFPSYVGMFWLENKKGERIPFSEEIHKDLFLI